MADNTNEPKPGNPDDKMVNPRDGGPAVGDLPPANPFDAPVQKAKEYSDGADAEIVQAANKPAETIVEHPLSPTDTNPNPHGDRPIDPVRVAVKDDDAPEGYRVVGPEDGDIEVEGTEDNPVFLGDGRTLGKGQRLKLTKDQAKDSNLKGKFKRV